MNRLLLAFLVSLPLHAQSVNGIPNQTVVGNSAFITGAGSANVMTGCPTPSIATQPAGLVVHVRPNTANTTTTPTFNLCSLGAQTIVKSSSGTLVALAASDYVTGVDATLYSTGSFWQLMNPQTSAASVTAFSGDGTLLSNSSSTGAVTATLANAAAHKFFGNNTGSSAAPGYQFIGIQDYSPNAYVAGGGSANAQTATYSPAITSLVAGLHACWLPVAANTTTTPTFAPNGLTAKTITKNGASALAVNDLTTTAIACVILDNTATNWQLQNPQISGGGVTTAGGIASISGSTLSVGAVSAATSTSVIIANPSVNTLNTSNAGAVYNTIAGGNGNTTASSTYQTISGGLSNSVTADKGTVGGGASNSAGNSATVPGGNNNNASGNQSFAAGDFSTASANNSVAIGDVTTASGFQSHVIGDHSTASGQDAGVFGSASTASGQNSVTLGVTASDRGNVGTFAFSGGGPSASSSFPARAQWEEHIFWVSCGGSSTSCRLTGDGSGASAGNVAALGNKSSELWTAEFLAADNTTGASLTYTFGPSLITRGASAATTAMGSGNPSAVAGPTTTSPPTLGTPTITADTTNGGYSVSAATPSGNTDNWYMVCRIRVLVTQYN